jgi:hypothetical protein
VTAPGGGGGSFVDGSFSVLSASSGVNGISNSGGLLGSNGYVVINGLTFNFSGGVQDYIVPLSGLYDILAVGAQGGGSVGDSGGFGASIEAIGFLTAGTDLKLAIGGSGHNGDFDGLWGGGGGGGTFVYTQGSAAPEPSSWAMMLGGFALIGGCLRSRRKATVSFG